MDIVEALTNLITDRLGVKDFTTGSKGFHATAKITVDGALYQAQAQAVLIGSKTNPHVRLEAGTSEIGADLCDLVARALTVKTFSSGRTGYLASGKITAGGQ